MSGMSREMMKMDGRDSVECQNWEKKDIDGIFEILNDKKDKNTNSVISYIWERKRKRGGEEKGISDRRFDILGFRERESDFSLKYRAI